MNNNGKIVVLADAKYNNPNHLGGKVTAVDIDVLVDDNKVATMEAIENFTIPKREEFTIPLRTTIPWESLSKNKGLLGTVLDAALTKEVTLVMEGDMKVDFET